MPLAQHIEAYMHGMLWPRSPRLSADPSLSRGTWHSPLAWELMVSRGRGQDP